MSENFTTRNFDVCSGGIASPSRVSCLKNLTYVHPVFRVQGQNQIIAVQTVALRAARLAGQFQAVDRLVRTARQPPEQGDFGLGEPHRHALAAQFAALQIKSVQIGDF